MSHWNDVAKARYRADPVFREERKAYSRAYYRLNKAKRLAYGAKRRAAMPIQETRSALGVTPLDITNMRAAQGGRCAICDITMIGRNEHLDHDHADGRIRGLLCGTCNKGLGQFKDSPTNLRAAAAYLEAA